MIFFIAPNPHTKKREGFLQRIYAIDRLFSSEEKKYIDDCKNEAEIVQALVEADVIYAHSMYQVSRIKDYIEYFAGKTIVDLHGVVPEELEYLGDAVAARVMSEAEAHIFTHVNHFIAVTEAMVSYYKKKYGKVAQIANWTVLPIFDESALGQVKSQKSEKLNIIYAGGTQKWQSVDKMLATMKRLKDSRVFTFTILSHDEEAFGEVKDYSNVVVASVAADEVLKYYSQATLGFILRDDSIVNRVACPTKLIEYFEHDIVPVVDTVRIGDFKDLGYKYINYKDLGEKTISQQQLRSIALHNHKVVEKLKRISDTGKLELKTLVDTMTREKTVANRGKLSQLASRFVSEIEGLKHANETLTRDLEKRSSEAAVVEEELASIKASKEWRFFSRLSRFIGRKGY